MPARQLSVGVAFSAARFLYQVKIGDLASRLMVPGLTKLITLSSLAPLYYHSSVPTWSPRKEFLLSSLIFLCFAALYFQKPLRSTWIAQVGPVKVAPGEGLVGASEAVYSGYPPYYFAARELRQGRLPLWMPYAGGGAPFIGNMQSGVLSPLHLMFYLVPAHYFQYLWLALFMLCFYIAWAPTFALARWYGIGFPGAVFAAACYTFSSTMVNYNIEAPGQTAIYTPALFLMAEQFLRGNRRRGLLWLPWLIALPVLSGHFQTSFMAWVSVGVYILCVSWADTNRPFIKNALVFAGLAAWGLALAAGQIVTGLEYISHSYTKVWRSLPEFGWTLRRMSKPLGADDAPCLILAAIGLLIFLWCLKRLKLKEEPGPGWSWFYNWAGGCVALGVTLAGLMNTGMLNPIFFLPRFTLNYPELLHYSPGLFLCAALLFLSLFALLDRSCPQGLKIFGGMVFVGILFYLKTPVILHAFCNLPFLQTTFLDNYDTPLQLGLALLGGYGLCRLTALAGQAGAERVTALFGIARLVVLLIAACALAQRLENPLARQLGVGINPELWSDTENATLGGIADGGKKLLSHVRFTIRGWLAGAETLQQIGVGFQQGNTPPVLTPAKVAVEKGRTTFEQELAVPEGASVPVAVAVNAAGQRKIFRGSELTRVDGPVLWVGLGLLAVPLLGFALLFFPARLKGSAAALVFICLAVYIGQMSQGAFVGANDDNLQTVWPALAKLNEDKGLFRIHSFDQYLYPAALSAIHQIADIRNGSDVLDVVTLIHYLQLTGALYQEGNQRKQDWGSRLLGLGNIKYLLARPNQPLPEKELSLIYSGPDMLVYRNQNFQERVRFYDNWKYIDGAPLDEWRQARQVLGSVYRAIVEKKLDLQRDLLLNEAPPLPYSWGQEAKPSSSSAEILEQASDRMAVAVNAANPGFLFISSNYYPGWKATVDGRPAKLLRSWVTFCAVPVSAGQHVVQFIYDSGPVNASLVVSFLAAIAWLIWVSGLTNGTKSENLAKPELKAAKSPKRKQEKLEIASPLPVSDGSVFIELLLGVFIGSYFLFWLNWCAWRYHGGWGVRLAAVLVLAGSGVTIARWAMTRLRTPGTV